MSHRITDSELLVVGYIHHHEKQLHIIIPPELYTIILIFYPRNYKLFGIGVGEFESNANISTKWQYLSKMSSLCQHPTFVTCANNNFFLRNMNNEIYAIGNNLHGCLGIDSSSAKISVFTKVQFKDTNFDNNNTLQFISKGSFTNHTFVVTKNIHTNTQTFYSFGKNSYQQQGCSGMTKSYPTKVHSLNTLFKNIQIIQISTGYSHSLFLTSKGKVYSCGENGYGQCGIAVSADYYNNKEYIKPQLITFLYDIIGISSGQSHNLCIDSKNRVWVFGDNTSYQLGLGEEYKSESQSDTAVMNPFFNADVDDTKIVFVECGDNFSLCISKNGLAYMFGSNDVGQCAKGDSDDDVCVPFCIQSMEEFKDVLFECGNLGCDHTQLISYYPNNCLYGFGSNSNHQTGNEISGVGYGVAQRVPYLNTKKHIGADEKCKIVGVLCDEDVTVVICEI